MTTPSRTTLEHELYDAADEVWPGPVLNGRVTDRHRRAERLRARAAAVREYQRQAAAPGSNPDMIRMLALLTGPDIEAAYELHTHPGGKCLTAPAPCLPYGSVCTSPRECGALPAIALSRLQKQAAGAIYRQPELLVEEFVLLDVEPPQDRFDHRPFDLDALSLDAYRIERSLSVGVNHPPQEPNARRLCNRVLEHAELLQAL